MTDICDMELTRAMKIFKYDKWDLEKIYPYINKSIHFKNGAITYLRYYSCYILVKAELSTTKGVI